MGIEGGIEQIEAIEFAEDDRVEHIVHGQRVGGVLRLDLFKPRQRAIVIEDVKALEGLAHQRVQVEWIRIHPGGCGNGATSRPREKPRQIAKPMTKLNLGMDGRTGAEASSCPDLETFAGIGGMRRVLGSGMRRIFSMKFI